LAGNVATSRVSATAVHELEGRRKGLVFSNNLEAGESFSEKKMWFSISEALVLLSLLIQTLRVSAF
jgi:hypothetical protein